MSNVRQISVFVDNKPNQLAGVMKLIKDSRINVRALSLADTKDFGMSAIYNSHYYRNGFENVDFADAVLKNCAVSSVNRAKGLFEADPDDVMLMALKMPAVRLKAGTITNNTEVQLLLKDDYLDRIATGIIDAIDVALKR